MRKCFPFSRPGICEDIPLHIPVILYSRAATQEADREVQCSPTYGDAPEDIFYNEADHPGQSDQCIQALG